MKNLENSRSPSWWFIWKNTVVTTVIEIPSSLGIVMRRIIYRTICARIGTSVKIYSSIEFKRADGIEIGNRARICSGVRLRNIGQKRK